MKLVNGWSQEEIHLLCERTSCSEELIIQFCQAVDKQLYLMLPTEAKRATLHFHLRNTPKEQVSSKEEASPNSKANSKKRKKTSL